MIHFRKESEISTSSTTLENWHYAPGAFQRLAPPWDRVRMMREPFRIADGSRAELAIKAGPFWTKWIAEHRECIPGESFTDIQMKGPFAAWKHRHEFHSIDHATSKLVDDIHYRLPMGAVGRLFAGGIINRKLQRTFRYRHAITKMDLERLPSESGKNESPLTVLVTGATGMVGSALESFLRMHQHRVRRVTRRPSRPGDIRWDIGNGEFELGDDEKIDAVIHLAGEGIADGRWTENRKQRILESRRLGTRLLCEKLASLKRPPRVLVSASGVNYYSQGTAEPQNETAPRGDSFLSEVCEAWEAETKTAEQAGIRVVKLRMGMVLSPAGGALSKMLPAFHLGLAGHLGTGQQRIAWIALDDVIDIMQRAIQDPRYNGVVNAVAPQIPTNREFTATLAEILNRPSLIPAPALALRLALGQEMAEETLLADLPVAPDKLNELGYPFRFPNLDKAFRFMLGRA